VKRLFKRTHYLNGWILRNYFFEIGPITEKRNNKNAIIILKILTAVVVNRK
jgi:hypothetical protein